MTIRGTCGIGPRRDLVKSGCKASACGGRGACKVWRRARARSVPSPATPTPSFARVGVFHHVDLHLRHAFSGDAERLGGAAGDVDHAAANERAAVVDPNRDRAASGYIGDAQPRAERQRAVRGS